MSFIKNNVPGILLCLAIAIPAWILGNMFPIIGGPVFAILFGMIIAFVPKGKAFSGGITFTSKKILQFAVILLGFGMNFFQIIQVGGQSLIIIITTISVALIGGFFLSSAIKIPPKEGTLVSVGSSICGGSAIAAAAPVIDADDEEIAKSISVIFFFNILAALTFPYIGQTLGFTDIGFGMWAGTAVNDTSSVTAVGASWAAMTGSDTALNYAVIVKMTRTLCIIPICLCLAFYRTRKAKKAGNGEGTSSVKLSKIFPWFILFFLGAAVVNTVLSAVFATGSSAEMVNASMGFLTKAGKFCITLAMAAIGLNTNIVKIVKTGGKSIFLGFVIWVAIAFASIGVQYAMDIAGMADFFI